MTNHMRVLDWGMASKVWQNWSFSRTFFIYDHEIVKREEDDPKLALVYFCPPSPEVSEDAQCLFSGQVMAMVSFMKNLVTSKPRIYCLKKMKIATVHEGRFTMAMASSFNTPDGIAIRKLLNLCSLFKFFQGSIQRVLQEHSDDRDAFVSHIGTVMPFFLSFVRYHDDKVRETFQDIPMVLLPKKSHLVHLKASHLLQWLKRRPKLLAGCIIYKHKVLCTQLTPSITRYLLTVKSKRQMQLPAIVVSLSFQLPVGVQIVTVFLKGDEYSAFSKSKASDREAKDQSDIYLSPDDGSDDLTVLNREEVLYSVERKSEKKHEREKEFEVTSSDTNDTIAVEQCELVGNHKDCELERRIDQGSPSSAGSTGVENGKVKEAIEIKSILKTPGKKHNGNQSRSTAKISEAVAMVTDTHSQEGIHTVGSIDIDKNVSKEIEGRKHEVSKHSVSGQLDLSLDQQDENTISKENRTKCNTDSEELLSDAISNSLLAGKIGREPSLGDSITIGKDREQDHMSGNPSPVVRVANTLSNGDSSTQSNHSKKVSIPGRNQVKPGETNADSRYGNGLEEYVNISVEGGGSMLEVQVEDSFTEWPPMGQRSISSASFMSSRRTSMFTDEGRSQSETDESDDMYKLCRMPLLQPAQDRSSTGSKKVAGMVDVSLYIQIHSEDLTIVFIAENSLKTDEKEINYIHQTIWSQSAELEKELKKTDQGSKTEPLKGGCNSVTFNTFEHALSTKFEANTPSDDGRFFQAARLLHNEFSKDAELKKVHLGYFINLSLQICRWSN